MLNSAQIIRQRARIDEDKVLEGAARWTEYVRFLMTIP